MERLSSKLIPIFFFVFGLSVTCFPFGASAFENADSENINPTSTSAEITRKDVDEGENIGKVESGVAESPTNSIKFTYKDTGIPIILPRSTWENNESLEKLLWWLPEEGHEPPDYRQLERIIVHDMGCPLSSPTCNSDNVDPIAVIQNVYRFHSVTRGWGDIGYNYIIDRQGKIYEGRYGGNGVRAAHVYHDRNCDNFNPSTVGIMLVGNYSSAPIPDIMQKNLERLVAWIAATNNLDLSGTITTKVWHNPKVGTYCDISNGGFTSSFSGPILLSHGDIEQGNSDKFDLSQVNKNAFALVDSISQYVYKATDNDQIYQIKSGVRLSYNGELATNEIQEETLPTSTNEIIKEENNTNQLPKLLAINKNQLIAFSPQDGTIYSDGTILKSNTRSLVFLIENKVRKKIDSLTPLKMRGLDISTAISITDRELAKYPYSGLLGFTEGSLLAEKETSDVYLVEKNKRRHITSAALFNALNFIWGNINPVSKEELKVHSVGDPLLFTDGTLIKGTNPRVWLIDSKKRRPISSAELFEALGLKWSEIKTLEDYEAGRYALGTFVSWPDATLIQGEETPEVYIVKNNGSKEWVPSAEEFESRGYQWKDVRTITREELNDYPLVGLNPTTAIQEEPEESSKESIVDETPSLPDEETPPVNESDNKGPSIRIAIYSLKDEDHVAMRAVGGTFRVLHNGNLILETKSQDEEFIVRYNELNPIGVARFEPIGNAILEITSYDARHPCVNNETWCRNINDNKFRGAIEIVYSNASKKFWVVNELPMEHYLRGIAEMINGDPLEYRKAFAIAARSYALYHLNRGGKREGEPYHLNNTSGDQVYKGYGFEQRAYDPVEGVELTNGQVATYNGEVIVAAYSSGAPGPTLSACTSWRGMFCESKFDYLDGGVADPEGTTYAYTSCGGANHCVGIDAAGARQMARNGKTYEEILKWYYQGVEIMKKW